MQQCQCDCRERVLLLEHWLSEMTVVVVNERPCVSIWSLHILCGWLFAGLFVSIGCSDQSDTHTFAK